VQSQDDRQSAADNLAAGPFRDYYQENKCAYDCCIKVQNEQINDILKIKESLR